MKINAKIIDVRYEKGWYKLHNGAKGGYKKYYKNGVYHKQSFGWSHDYCPSKLIVTVALEETASDYKEVLVDRFFKQMWGNLTNRRLEGIMATVPTTIRVEEAETERGYQYYQADEDDLREWMTKAQQAI